MNEIKFGFTQVMKATPTIIGRIRNAMNVSIIGLTPLIGDIAVEFNVSEKKLQLVIAIVVVGLNFISSMFGVPLDGRSVPADKVTEVETS